MTLFFSICLLLPAHVLSQIFEGTISRLVSDSTQDAIGKWFLDMTAACLSADILFISGGIALYIIRSFC